MVVAPCGRNRGKLRASGRGTEFSSRGQQCRGSRRGMAAHAAQFISAGAVLHTGNPHRDLPRPRYGHFAGDGAGFEPIALVAHAAAADGCSGQSRSGGRRLVALRPNAAGAASVFLRALAGDFIYRRRRCCARAGERRAVSRRRLLHSRDRPRQQVCHCRHHGRLVRRHAAVCRLCRPGHGGTRGCGLPRGHRRERYQRSQRGPHDPLLESRLHRHRRR